MCFVAQFSMAIPLYIALYSHVRQHDFYGVGHLKPRCDGLRIAPEFPLADDLRLRATALAGC